MNAASTMGGHREHPWYGQFFQVPLYDESTGLTVDPARQEIQRKDHVLLPVVSLVGPGEADRVPAKGLILAPFHLPEQLNDPSRGPAALHRVEELAAQLSDALRGAYGDAAELRHLIWAGMGGSIEDKYAGIASNLFPQDRVRVWGLDDINPETLGHILRGVADAEAEGTGVNRLAAGLRKTVIVAQALGMTSVEPVFNVKHALAPIFTSHGLEVATHFYKITIPGSLLDQALQAPVQNIEHQPFGQSTCAGRHDYVSHGMLLPLQLCGGSETVWKYVQSLFLEESEIDRALELAEWMVADPVKDKVVLLPPKEWAGQWYTDSSSSGKGLEWREAILWFKQHIEESLGKVPGKVLKIVTTLSSPTSPIDQHVLILQVPGLTCLEGTEEQRLKAAGFSVQVLRLESSFGPQYALPKLFQIFSILKYRIAELWRLCAVNQPPVEYYKRVVSFMENDAEGRRVVEALLSEEPEHIVEEAGISMNFHIAVKNGALAWHDVVDEIRALGLSSRSLGDVLGCLLRIAARRASPKRMYGEYIYFGNLTRGADAQAMRDLLLNEGAGHLWASALASFADVGKGPGVGHATHAMGKQGQVVTLSIVPSQHGSVDGLCSEYPTGYQTNNAYANVLALGGYDVVATGERQELQPGHGHPGLVVLVRVPQNDEAVRKVLADIFSRAAVVVKIGEN